MKIIKEITFHEMKRRFAIGEVHSVFFKASNSEHQKKMLCLLNSGDENQEIEGIKQVLNRRKNIVQFLEDNVAKWYLANLPITRNYFSAIHTFPGPEWFGYSGGTGKLIDAANTLRDAPGTDSRVDSIVSAFKQGNVEMQGITLTVQSKEGPFTIAEGNGRLVAVYLCCVDEQSCPTCKSEIEVALGTIEIR